MKRSRIDKNPSEKTPKPSWFYKAFKSLMDRIAKAQQTRAVCSG